MASTVDERAVRLAPAGSSGRVRWAFVERHGGVSDSPYASLNLGGHVGDGGAAVASNRSRLEEALGAGVRIRYMNQVHGDVVDTVRTQDQPVAAAADAMATALPGTALAVLVADCVPVLLADPVAGVVAAAHAGRPGVRNGVVVRTLEAMAELGAQATRTAAWLGPAVCPLHYEVPAGMCDDVAAVVPATRSTSEHGTPALDLRSGLVEVLTAYGVTVDVVGPCTAESTDHFSYRRDGVTGRFAGVVWLQP